MPVALSYAASTGLQPEPEFVQQMEYFCKMDTQRQELFRVRGLQPYGLNTMVRRYADQGCAGFVRGKSPTESRAE